MRVLMVCVCVCVCYGPTGRGTRTGHASGTRNRHGGATRGRVHTQIRRPVPALVKGLCVCERHGPRMNEHLPQFVRRSIPCRAPSQSPTPHDRAVRGPAVGCPISLTRHRRREDATSGCSRCSRSHTASAPASRLGYRNTSPRDAPRSLNHKPPIVTRPPPPIT